MPRRCQPGRVPCKISDARIERGEARVGGLAFDPSEVDLLNHHRDFEQGEHLIEADVRDVAR